MIEIHDYIKPGEYRYCAAGEHLIADHTMPCPACLPKARLSDYECGVCGEMADVMFVYGYRCEAHRDIKVPSQMLNKAGLVGTVGRLKTKIVYDRKKIVRGLADHERLLAERQALAEKRFNEGMPRLFWMQK